MRGSSELFLKWSAKARAAAAVVFPIPISPRQRMSADSGTRFAPSRRAREKFSSERAGAFVKS